MSTLKIAAGVLALAGLGALAFWVGFAAITWELVRRSER